MRHTAKTNTITRTIAAASLLALRAFATEGGPLAVELTSADALQQGQPVRITMTMKTAADIQHATVQVQPSSDWQVLDGPTQWVGSLKKGQTLDLHLRAVPLTSTPAPLGVRYKADGYLAEGSSLDAARLGGKTPEREKALEPITGAQPFIRAQPEADDNPHPQATVKSKSSERQARVTVSGRFRYRDDDDDFRPVMRAKVEIVNVATGFADPIDSNCGTTTTDMSGAFNLSVDCFDIGSGPDLAARITLDNSKVTVRPEGGFAYSFQSGTRMNRGDGSLDFGNITITSNRGAFHIHNLITRAERFLKNNSDEDMEKITVLWPKNNIDVAHYNSFWKEIRLQSSDAFAPRTVFHEYGHHILHTKAESPSPDYDNGICDDPSPGHCADRPEKGVVSWTEGWPTFLAVVLFNKHRQEDGYDGDMVGATETRFSVRAADDGKEDRIEGVVTALLWDLVDDQDDDQFATGAGRRDRVNLTFNDIWDVIRNYDPSSDWFHNHPTSIHELWEGLRSRKRSQINRISEAYQEHNIKADQPDLLISATGPMPGTRARGTAFLLSNTARNAGDDPAIAAFTVTIQMRNPNFTPVIVGSRTVPADLASGATSQATTNITIPATLAPGTWTLRVCADSGGAVPESDEDNNCRDAGTINVTVTP